MHDAPHSPRQLAREYNAARRNARLYQSLANLETDESKSALYLRISESESKLARYWLNQIDQESKRGGRTWSPSLALYGLASRILPSQVVGGLLRSRYQRWLSANSHLLEDDKVRPRALVAAEALDQLSGDELTEGQHHEHGWLASQSGALRAAVLGLNDGLVSNFSLTMGLAGATSDASIVLVAGLAGLLAGALSMAAGEYVSVKSQNEYYANLIRWERAELILWGEQETEELIELFVSKGLKRDEAEVVATRLMSDPDIALDTHVREELGIDPDDLGGSPWTAATSSLLAFAAGAAVPVIPYAVGLSSSAAIWISATVSLLALATVGGSLGWLSGFNVIRAGIRMTLIGAGAASLTWLLGAAVGTQLAG